MAIRVPTVNGPSVSEAPLQGGMQRSSVSPALVQNTQLQQAGRAMEEIGAQIQEREDADMVMRAETQIKGDYLQWEGEAKQRKGQQAWGVAKEASQWWDDNAKKASETLRTPRQQALFARTVDQHKALSVGAFSGFEAGQRRASLDESAQASIVGSINLAAANANLWQAPLYVATKETPTGMVEKGNIDLAARPVVQNKDGSVSTVRSITVGMDGKEFVLPTVSPDGKIMTEEQAIEHFRKTGQHLGAFSDPKAADAYAQALHLQQEQMYAGGTSNPIAAAKQDILRRNQMRAQINGWSPEMAEAKRMEYLTNFHKQVLQGLVRDNPDQAEAYFNANKAEIEGSQHAEVGAFAAKATATRMGEQTAASLWQQLGPKGDRDPVQLDVLEQAVRDNKGIGDEAKKSAIAALRERAVAFKDARKERDDALEASVNKAIMGGAGATQVGRMPEFMQLDGEKQRRLMDFMENRSLRNEQRAAARESRAASAETREQARLARQGMGAYLIYSNPDTLAGMTENQVLNLLPDLGNELTAHLMQQKRALANNPQKLSEARMDDDDFKQVAQEMGLRPFAAKTEEEKAALGALKYRVEQMISAAQSQGGKALARDQKLNLMRQEMARKVTVDGWFSNSEVPVIALKPEEVAKVIVPAADRREIAEQMQAMARQYPNDPRFKPTEDNLRRWYLRGKSPAANLIPNGR